MYTSHTGSACDSGQMAHVQSMCRRPASGPTANWLETPSKQQQQPLKEDGEPVAVRVMTNGSGAPSERSDNYVRPFPGSSQPQPASPPSHLAFLYDRAQQPVKSPLTEMAACPNGFVGVTSPRADEYRSLSRAVPAPIHQYQVQQQQQQPSTAAGTLTDTSSEYNPFSRATPAPIQQHSPAPAVGAERPATVSSADAGTPTSPRATQHVNSEPRAAEVTYTFRLSRRILHTVATSPACVDENYVIFINNKAELPQR